MKKIKVTLLLSVSFMSLIVALGPTISDFFLPPEFRHLSDQGNPPSRRSAAVSRVEGYPFKVTVYITDCKKIPKNLEEIFHKTKDNEACNRFANYDPKDIKFKPLSDDPAYQGYQGWIDPWGRPYQIRYDLERGKLQVRSQGRYLWTELDDIVGETSLSIPKVIEDEMLEKCKQMQKDDPKCPFYRGWH